MTQAIQLGTVLGGRYKVTAQIVATGAQDQVLDGKDQVLERKVSILVASPDHSDLLIENARGLATGARPGSLQVLDLGQSEDVTYLITSHAKPEALLDLLRTDHQEADSSGEELGGEIFGGTNAPAAPSSDYEQVGTETSPQEQVSAAEEEPTPAVTEWTDADYEAFGEEPPAQRSNRSARSGGTLFDRAATDVAGGSGAAAASLHHEDDTYDGDNRYRYDHDDEEPIPAAEDEEYYDDEEDYWDEGEDAYEEPERRRSSVGLWITAVVVIILLILLVVFGFGRLGTLVSQSSPAPNGTVTSASSRSDASSSASSGSGSESSSSPAIAEVSRVVPENPGFMADQDATLPHLIDKNPQTDWTSYGFSDAQFGGLIKSFALAAELKQPAPVKQVTVNSSQSTGGHFDVYTSDSPSLDGATKAGSGEFQEGESTVDLSDDASSHKARYVIINITSMPHTRSPIGGYQYGARIAEITVK